MILKHLPAFEFEVYRITTPRSLNDSSSNEFNKTRSFLYNFKKSHKMESKYDCVTERSLEYSVDWVKQCARKN